MQKLMDRDFLAAVVLFVLGSVALAKSGADVMNWAFPLMATYFILFAAAILVVPVFVTAIAKRTPDIIRVSVGDRVVAQDVLVFLVIALGYLLVMYGLGFWLASFVMLSLTSIYLTLEKTRRSVGLAIVVPFATCVVAYLVFQEVFYVPVPAAHWWPFAG